MASSSFSKKLKGFILFLLLTGIVTAYNSYLDLNQLPQSSGSPTSPQSRTVAPSAEWSWNVATASSRSKKSRSPAPSNEVLSGEFSPIPSGSGFFVTEGGSVRQHARVVRIIDGDTIEIQGGHRVRYIGIDTPETVKPGSPLECYGEEAAKRNTQLVEGKEIEMEKDVSETDSNGRLLRYVFVENTFVNNSLVELGYAYAVTYPPDVKYRDLFSDSQKVAQENNAGLWGSQCPAREDRS